jgi:signal transduction histidine kinase
MKTPTLERATSARLDGLRGLSDPVPASGDISRRLRTASAGPAGSAERRSRTWLGAGSYALLIAIVVLDWATPPGVAVAILVSIPFMLLALLDDSRQIWIAGAVALVARAVDMLISGRPAMPVEVWLPNRVLVITSIIASMGIAHLLFRERAWAQRARDAALDARDMNRLLVSLMAHDLRSPLVVANDALAYAERTAAGDEPIDIALLADARARLQRSLRTVESILTVAQADVAQNEPRPGSLESNAMVSIRSSIASELALFAPEAAVSKKSLVSQFELAEGDEWIPALDARVIRQGLAILLDNAIRYANPGRIDIEVTRSQLELCVRVADSGPGLSGSRGSTPTMPFNGSGLGLELCRALLKRAGARLDLERDDVTGTVFVLRLPTLTRNLATGSGSGLA